MGFDKDRFTGEVDDDFRCSICRDIIEDPIASQCEHVFCKVCIDEWLQRELSCPVDREPLIRSQLCEPSRFFRNFYAKLVIKCEFTSNGCKNNVKIENLKSHQNKCQFNPIVKHECEKGCKALLTRNEKTRHNCVEYLKSINIKLKDELEVFKTRESEHDYGMCHKCGEKVLGEGSGCTAMEKVYHILCFTCHICHAELRGKPFYAMDGKPYCEEDYLNTLEKCCVCEKPILDRILRATGKPYHPSCFTCVVCRKALDGIPFTVDATNQIHCIDDFHKKFAPRCCVCKEPIVPEPGKTETVRVVALDRSFHVSCYKCEDCDLLLSSEAKGRGCFPLDDHILCRNCNAKRVQ